MAKRAPKRPSQRRFDLAPQVGISRSTFDLSFPLKTAFDSGLLIPTPPIEVLPGDSFRLRMSSLVRLATPIHPTMDNLHLETFWFFVPNRLVWENWQKFMGEQDNPSDSTDFQLPSRQLTGGPDGINTLQDYFGLPVVGHTGTFRANDLPFRGYNLCFNEWFKDQNLQDAAVVDKGDGASTLGNYVLRRRGKRKNYITSALPWPQKGPGVEIPIGATAPIVFQGAENDRIRAANTTANQDGWEWGGTNVGTNAFATQVSPAGGNLVADLAAATGATINDWREAFQLQKLQERDARGGTRYTEILKSHFQVTSPDSRLQRPELLATGSSPIQMNTVPQTSETAQGSQTPQGNLAAYAQGIQTNHGFTKSFVEHGYILGMINVRADLTFQKRLDRHWSRETKYDFYWPALQALGEQAVLQREVFTDGTAQDNTVWGYQERWAEYRQIMGTITGQFRSQAATTLDPWHYALDFGNTPPALNATFIEDNPPVKRTIAVTDQPEFIMDAWLDIKAARPMPTYSVPGYIDHF